MEMIDNIEKISCQDIAREILEKISARVGVNLEELIRTDDVSGEKFTEFKQHIVRDILVRFRQFEHENPNEDYGATETSDEKLILSALSAEAEPNLMINPNDLEVLAGFEGEKILSYIKNLTKRFETMTEQQKPGMIAAQLLAIGLLGVGIRAGYGAWLAWTTREATTYMAAAAQGVRFVGTASFLVTAGVFLASLLYWLFYEYEKSILGIVINKSNKDLITKNYKKENQHIYIKVGKISNFMEDQYDLSSPIVQIKGAYVDPIDPNDSFYFAGVYFAEKNPGFYGTCGIFTLTPNEKGIQPHMALLYACPYTKRNGTKVKVVDNASSSRIDLQYDAMFKARCLKSSSYSRELGGRITSKVNSTSGNIAGNIAIIELDE